MRVLIIDNYDSFTYNLVQLIAEVSGVEPLVVLNDQMTWAQLQTVAFDAIVLSPGPGRADRPGDFGLCRDAIADGRWPILGVCLGHQGIAYHFGGRLDYAPEPTHGRASQVRHLGEDLFAGVPSPFKAVRYHSFVARDLPKDLVVTATTDEGLIMALRHVSRPMWGVQFHPESVATEHGARLIANFLSLAAAWKPPQTQSAQPAPPAPVGVATEIPSPLALYWRRLTTAIDPEAAFLELYKTAPSAFWLDSSAVIAGRSRYSFMGDAGGPNSERLIYRVGGHLERVASVGVEHLSEPLFDYLEHRLGERPRLGDAPPVPFLGGFVGYLGYELKAETGGDLLHPSPHADAQLIFADRLVAFDHVAGEAWLLCLERPQLAARAEAWLDATQQRLSQLRGEVTRILPSPAAGGADAFKLLHDQPTYLDLIRRALVEITDGESYEVCLTTRSNARLEIDPLTAYRALRAANPAPYAAWLRFDALNVLCCSPERFVRIDRGGAVESKPIKGTIQRDADTIEDERLKVQLHRSEKDRAENLMIVDLIRNDLGRVCATGSVQVPKLCHIETYASVHQMVSTVTGQLAPGASAIGCVRALFPGGSMTGAPKIRTMQIIDRLEGAPRGVYSGAIGYFSVDGAVDLNITIRTVVVKDGQATIGAGGALVALSDPQAEFEEVLLKSRLIRETLGGLAAFAQAETADLARSVVP